MVLNMYSLDLILVPSTVCLTAWYHVYRWKHLKKGCIPRTTGRKEAWIQSIFKENKKKDMLGVQSLRNSLMSSILSATVSILLNTALAALTNNAYRSNFLSKHRIFGSQGDKIILVKFAVASFLLLTSFFFNTIAIGSIIEANFLINVSGETFNCAAKRLLKRGWFLASVGNRVLFSTGPFLVWLFGPVPLILSSAMLIGFFYSVDFNRVGPGGSKAICM
ncbi:hypothetical protein LUZ61_017521 [Rhynchospora tenuis]|uniref:DUF599 domain-containing protein n=1 Tax=Rhynchospora tenuis TaxID=198213 RepID=A0AAD5Z7K2_9POAL|nr:hypothetical protein LUZ61_017521 [Rhynchospora tenuis]